MINRYMVKFGIVKGWKRAVLAGFLALIVLTPTFDVFGCLDDLKSLPGVTEVSSLVSEVGDVPNLPQGQDSGGYSLCFHCGCHHGFGLAKLGDRFAFKTALTLLEPPRSLYVSPSSAPPLQLLRPPRA